MTSLQAHTDRNDTAIIPVGDDPSLNDWLGWAGYLAGAVTDGDLTVEAASAELAVEATGSIEREALRRAVDAAAVQFGIESPLTSMLREALARSALTSNPA